MSNKLVKNDKSKRMERIAKLIKEYATEVFLGWEFIIRQKGDGYFVGTARESAKGYPLCALCYVEKETVTIKVVSGGCTFQKEEVQPIIDEMLFPMTATMMADKDLVLKSDMPISCMETDVAILACNRMVTMANALSALLLEKIG